MTTSLAALAASSTAHTSSNVLMSTNLSSPNSPSPVIDITDSNYEIKTEFYTREGLWKLIPSLDYARQNQTNNNLNSPNSSQNYNTLPNTNSTPQQTTQQNFQSNTNQDPVKINLFKFKKNFIFKQFLKNSKTNRKYMCTQCLIKRKSNLKKLNESDDDDDDVETNSVVFKQINSSDDDDTWSDSDEDELNKICKICKTNIIENNYTESSEDDNYDESGAEEVKAHKDDPSLDLMMFNYAKEIYTYESAQIQHKNEIKNLMDKKTYKTVMSTCFDINVTASVSNTVSLQLNRTQNASLSDSDFDKINFSTSPSQLSLIVAAGFNKGEIHVFDVFKKDASVFYNNMKLVEKTKVTCIKWLPKSMNLFLVSYSSGNIYLYDVNFQNQSSIAPTFTKIYQNDSFSVYTNNTSSTPNTPQLNSPQSEIKDNSSSASLTSQSRKLVLSNSNQQQQQNQSPKNPLLKLNIGPDPNLSYCINEFEFSPCGKYLAIVSQDGYLRVFSFLYKNNQEMQFQLKCSMKSYFGGLLCVTWSPDGKFIATGGEDDIITVFNFVEMRVACRGRGHSSWVNCITFDPWAKLSSNLNFFSNLNEESDDDESDLEDYHTKQQEIEKNLEKLEIEKKAKITAPKKRTISTLSDFNNQSFSQSSTIFYRLASVGQDNQICFWDLTEDVLKEKPSNRSRITTMIQQSQYHNQIQVQSAQGQDHVKPSSSSLVSTAKSLFSSKSSSSEKSNENDEQTVTPKTNTLTGSFFRRHKRNPSLNSTSSQVLSAETKTKNSKTPIVLNSYKKSSNLFSNLTPVENTSPSPVTPNMDNSVGSAKKSPLIQVNSPFNLCPKLDEVPLIEPLICKRISNERLTSIVFKRDCFLVASQDGFLSTWARPRRKTKSSRFTRDTNSTCL